MEKSCENHQNSGHGKYPLRMSRTKGAGEVSSWLLTLQGKEILNFQNAREYWQLTECQSNFKTEYIEKSIVPSVMFLIT